MLIIASGEDVRDLTLNDGSIRYIHIDENRTVGELRNFGCSKAHGDVIAHWDDDDVSYRTRLEDQVSMLHASGKSVAGYRDMIFGDDQHRWWLYHGRTDYAVGTSLCYKKSWWKDHPFQAVQVGEDGRFVEEAARNGQLQNIGGAWMIVASIHGKNTSPRTLLGINWEQLEFLNGNILDQETWGLNQSLE